MSRVAGNAISNYIGQAYSILITLASVPIYIKYLGAEAYGLIGFFIILQSFSGLLDFGLSATINRKVAQARAVDSEFSLLFGVLKIVEPLFAIVFIVIFLAIYFNGDFISVKWIKAVTLTKADIAYCLMLMGVIMGFRLYSTLYRSGINGFEDQIWNNKNNMLVNSIKYGGSIVLLIVFSQKIQTYFEYQLVAAAFEMWLLRRRFYKNMASYVVNIQLKRLNCAELFSIVPFCLSVAYTSAVVIVIMQLDKLLLSRIIGLQELGYLNVVSTITSLVLVMATPVFLAFLPNITMLATGKSFSEMRSVYSDMTKVVALVTACATVMIAYNAKIIIFTMTGSKEAEAWGAEILVYYAIGTGFYVLSNVQYYLLSSLGNLRPYVIGCTVSLLLLVPSIYVITKKYNVLGASYVWMIYGVVWFFFWGALVHCKMLPNFHFRWLLRDILPLLTSIIVTTFAVSEVVNITDNDSRTLALVKCIIAGVFVLLVNALWLTKFRSFIFINFNLKWFKNGE